MTQRKIGKSPALAAPYGKPDMTAAAIMSRAGTHVLLSAGGDKSAQVDRMWISALNANRKPDREQLAMALTTLASARGALVIRRDTPATRGFGGAGIDLSITLNGVGALISIDNLHGGRYNLISWYNDYSAGRRPCRGFSARFATCVGDTPPMGGGRTHHKATSCGGDWYSVAMFLDGGLMLAARGTAFEPETT